MVALKCTTLISLKRTYSGEHKLSDSELPFGLHRYVCATNTSSCSQPVTQHSRGIKLVLSCPKQNSSNGNFGLGNLTARMRLSWKYTSLKLHPVFPSLPPFTEVRLALWSAGSSCQFLSPRILSITDISPN